MVVTVEFFKDLFAAKLRGAGLPVLQLGELHMWGRGATGVGLEDDEELVAAIGALQARPAPERTPAKRAATSRRRR